MTEAEQNRVLRTREMSVRTRAPGSKQYVKLPDDFLGMRNIELVTSPVTGLEYRNLENLDAHRASDATGKPIFYSIMQIALLEYASLLLHVLTYVKVDDAILIFLYHLQFFVSIGENNQIVLLN